MDRKFSLQFLSRVYGMLLGLYPHNYLEEYREELQAVFDLSLQEAARKGRCGIAAVAMRELLGLPGAILCEHQRQRRRNRRVKQLGARFDFTPGSMSETLAALAPLLLLTMLSGLLFAADSIFGRFPTRLATVLSYLSLGLFFILLLVGFVKGLPRWSMPYMGLLLAFFSLSKFADFLYANYDRYFWHGRLWIWDELVSQMYMWSGLTLVVMLLVTACAILPMFQRIRRDWTLLSFLVYGALPLCILITFDEYRKAEPYQLLIFIVLALGVWFYLHTNGKWKRFLVLFGALTFSLWIGAVSRGILRPYQTWHYGNQLDWAHELLAPIPMWLWLTFTMLIPSFISLFPRVRNHTVTEPPV